MVVSLHTSTGFGLGDYELWSQSAQWALLLVMIVGGMAGSTSGGIKVVRAYLVYKYFLSEFTRLLHPQAVVPVRIHGVPVQRDVMVNVLNYVGLYLIWILVATLLVTGTGLDWVSSLSAVVSTLGGVGPGMGSVGPFDNYDHLHAVAKWILSLCMLLGRLEFYSVLILLSPAYWRR
jgi:trk system potassium uptake protein TrkH